MKQLAALVFSLSFTSPLLASEAFFRLYDVPSHDPVLWCDSYTKLHLSSTPRGGMQATLSNVLEGECDLAVIENKRLHFELQVEGDGCGSLIYTSPFLKIIDHRNRVCRDMVLAKIIVQEGTLYGTSTYYSLDK